MIPFSKIKGEYLNEFRIGTYPPAPEKQAQRYKKPKGFVEVTEKNTVSVQAGWRLS